MEQMTFDLIRQVNDLQKKVDGLVKPEIPGPIFTYTPTVTQNGVVTSTTNLARYFPFYSYVIVTVAVTLTAAGTAGNSIEVSLPITPAQAASTPVGGSGYIIGNSSTFYGVTAGITAGGNVNFIGWAQTSVMGISPSFALANNDFINFNVIYER